MHDKKKINMLILQHIGLLIGYCVLILDMLIHCNLIYYYYLFLYKKRKCVSVKTGYFILIFCNILFEVYHLKLKII